MSEVNMELAKSIYESACKALDNMEINYRKVEEDLVILFGHRGKDMNHDLIMAVNAQQEAVQIVEKLPFRINPERAADVASAVCLVNDRLLAGKFCYDLDERLSFEVNQVYTGSLVGDATIARMLMALVVSVEAYDDKFMALNNGYLKVDDFRK